MERQNLVALRDAADRDVPAFLIEQTIHRVCSLLLPMNGVNLNASTGKSSLPDQTVQLQATEFCCTSQ
jgi:hypothetical protein